MEFRMSVGCLTRLHPVKGGYRKLLWSGYSGSSDPAAGTSTFVKVVSLLAATATDDNLSSSISVRAPGTSRGKLRCQRKLPSSAIAGPLIKLGCLERIFGNFMPHPLREQTKVRLATGTRKRSRLVPRLILLQSVAGGINCRAAANRYRRHGARAGHAQDRRVPGTRRARRVVGARRCPERYREE